MQIETPTTNVSGTPSFNLDLKPKYNAFFETMTFY